MLAVASALPAGAAEWLLRITPAAAFASSRPSRSTTRSTTSTARATASTHSRPGPASPCCAPTPLLALGLASYLLRSSDA